jgi:hypothetical protein
VVLAVLVAGLLAAFLWNRFMNGSDSNDPSGASQSTTSQSSAYPAPAPNPPAHSLALLFVAPGAADTLSTLYLDGVPQGTLQELASGLLVESGVHKIVALEPDGDTLYARLHQLRPSDTLSLIIQ